MVPLKLDGIPFCDTCSAMSRLILAPQAQLCLLGRSDRGSHPCLVLGQLPVGGALLGQHRLGPMLECLQTPLRDAQVSEVGIQGGLLDVPGSGPASSVSRACRGRTATTFQWPLESVAAEIRSSISTSDAVWVPPMGISFPS